MASQSAFQLEEHDYKSIGHLITKMVFIFFNNTNKWIGSDKVKMSDFRNLNDKNWEIFYNQHEQFFKLVCSEILENGYIFVTNETHNISELPVPIELRLPNNTTQQDLDGRPVDNKHEQRANIEPQEEEDEVFELLEMEELYKSPQNLEIATKESCEEVPIEDRISPASNTSSDSGAFFLDALDSLKKKESTDDGSNFKKAKYDFSNTLIEEIDHVCDELDKSQQEIREDLHSKVEYGVWMKSGKSSPTEAENMESAEIDSDFKKKENEQKNRNEKKLEEARRKREQKQEEHRKELEEMRRQQKLCFATLLNCIQLRNRFEEKEQEVSDWIKKCYKQPVSSFIRRFLDFESFANQLKQFKKTPQESLWDVTQEVLNLNKSASRLNDSLENSFNQLEDLFQINSDAKFLRILQISQFQSSIANHALILHRVMDKLEEANLTNFWYSELENLSIQFQSVIIPSTEMLRQTCKNDFCPEWESMKFAKREMKSSVQIEEVFENF
ncbi:hypothetical protein CRE_05808 [Caenorhabditis remanei]|uniref:Uncharacterized protein n=1 Tax=Caenorhabditis remanei TaxID=31234 RepID=E3M080_CAERE|nr:hypothetical protein CRE_05808 [Caenorhabditis remanei]